MTQEVEKDLKVIKDSQLTEYEMGVVSRCERINPNTVLSRLAISLSRIFIWVVLAWIVVSLAIPRETTASMGKLVIVFPIIVFLAIFSGYFSDWVIIKKLSLRVSLLERKLEEARKVLK